jgi:hypothetical protein
MGSQSDISYYNNFDGKIAVKRGVVLTSHKIQVRFFFGSMLHVSDGNLGETCMARYHLMFTLRLLFLF